MKKLYLCLLLVFVLQSCVTNYYYVTLDADTELYSGQDQNSSTVHIIPAGTAVYVNPKVKKNFQKIKYGTYIGWAYQPRYTSPSTYRSNTTTSSSSPSSNYSSETSSGTVNVKGYYRKNGTYVRPHTRSAPRRR